MTWFDRLANNRFIDGLILVDSQGNVLRTSVSVRSARIASMLESADALAQALTTELGQGVPEVVQLTTADWHLLLWPLLASRYYVLVIVKRTAPLMLVMVELRRVLADITLTDVTGLEREYYQLDEETAQDAAELIEAVREWLRRRPPRS